MAQLPVVGDSDNQWGDLLNTFLLVSLNPDGTLKVTPFENPMTALGDLIIGGIGGVANRLPVGGNGLFLGIVNGVPTWLQVPSGFSNPMTTVGDLIIAGGGGVAQRLGIGGAGQVLGISGGSPAWVTNPAGFANPMTSSQDLIVGGVAGAAGRLAVGSNGQVLGVTAGLVGWLNNPAGFANPMTSPQDLIVGGTAGAAGRLAVGANGQVLGVTGGNVGWVAPPSSTPTYQVVFPSGDTSGITDRNNINNAITALTPGGGIILLAPGNFYVAVTSGGICINLPAQTTSGTSGGFPISLQGSGKATTLFPVGAAVTGISYHRTSGYGAQYGLPAQLHVGFIRDLVIDGTNTTGASIGLDVGDGWGFDIKVAIVNFDTVGAIGFNNINRVFWSEKGRYTIDLSNNSTNAVIGATQVAGSHEYNEWDFFLFAQTLQQGIVLQQGAYCNHCYMRIIGNMANTSSSGATPTNNLACLSLISAAGQNFQTQLSNSRVDLMVEANGGNGSGSTPPYGIFSDGTAFMDGCFGIIHHSLTDSKLNGAKFTYRGRISGDFNLNTAWQSTAFPGLGVQWVNNGPDANVTIAGGNISAIKIRAQTTGATSGTFFVPASSNIEVDGLVVPSTWQVTPAS